MLHARHITVDPMVFTIAYVVVTGAIALVLDARGLLNAAFAYLAPLAGGLLMFGIFGLARTSISIRPICSCCPWCWVSASTTACR